MALIKCKECGKEISEDARKCPYCGCPKYTVKMSKKAMIILRVIGIIILVGFIITCVRYKEYLPLIYKSISKSYN